MSKTRWAVVGTSGFALDWIARGITLGSNAELIAIVSRDQERARAAADRMAVPLAYTSIEAIDRDAVDGVFIVTPNTLHAPLAIAAARRGLHVIVEKPMAPTLEECQAMIDAANAAGVVLAVAHCTEWSPTVARASELVREGALGQLIQATIGASFNSPARGQWRQTDSTEQGGGPLFDMGIHAIDVLQSLAGPMTEVAALFDRQIHEYAAEDTTTTIARFESGTRGIVQANFNCSQNTLELIGTGGRLVSNSWLGRDFAGHLILEQDGTRHEQALNQVNVYVPQIEHVSTCIQNGTTPVISGERGRRNVAVIRAAIESARTGCTAKVRA